MADLFMILEVVLPAESPLAHVAQERLGLCVDQHVPLELELGGELFIATCPNERKKPELSTVSTCGIEK